MPSLWGLRWLFYVALAETIVRQTATCAADIPASVAPPARVVMRPQFDGVLPGRVLMSLSVKNPSVTSFQLEKKLARLLNIAATDDSASPGIISLFVANALGSGHLAAGDLVQGLDEIELLYAAHNGQLRSMHFLPGLTPENIRDAWLDTNRLMRRAHEEFAKIVAQTENSQETLSESYIRKNQHVCIDGCAVHDVPSQPDDDPIGQASDMFAESRVTAEGPKDNIRYRVAWPDGRRLYAWSVAPYGLMIADISDADQTALADSSGAFKPQDVFSGDAEAGNPIFKLRAAVTARETARAFAWMDSATAGALPLPPENPGDIRVLMDLAKIRRDHPDWLNFLPKGKQTTGFTANLERASKAALNELLADWRGLSLSARLGGEGFWLRLDGWPEEPPEPRQKPTPLSAARADEILNAMPAETIALVYGAQGTARAAITATFLKEALGLKPVPGTRLSSNDIKAMAVRLTALESALRTARSLAIAWVPDHNEVPHFLFVIETEDEESARLLGQIAAAIFAGHAVAVPASERLVMAFGPRANKLAERLAREWRSPRKESEVNPRLRAGLALLGDAPAADGFAIFYPGDALRSGMASVENGFYGMFLNTTAGRLTTVRLAAPRSIEPIVAGWGAGPEGRPVMTLRLPDSMFGEIFQGAQPLFDVMRAAVDVDMIDYVVKGVLRGLDGVMPSWPAFAGK